MEDEHILAVAKPSGLAVHGGSGISHGVIERLRGMTNGVFLELAHRLDKDTSGVLLLAKKPAALRELQRQWRNRAVHKKYVLAVFGRWQESAARITLPLVRRQGGIGSRVAGESDTDGKEAITRTRVLKQWPQAALLEADIITGRTHQLRVHLAQAGLPIIGDKKYGDFSRNQRAAGLNRLFLHAKEISFSHPAGGEKTRVTAPLPAAFDDLRQFFGRKTVTLVQAFASVSGMTFLSRLFGLARDVTLAAVFGATVSADAFFAAFRLPNTLRRFTAEGALTQAFVPAYAQAQKESDRQAAKLAGETAAGLGLLLLFISVLCVIAAPWIIAVIAPGLPDKRWHPIYCVLSFPTSYSFHWWRWPPVC